MNNEQATLQEKFQQEQTRGTLTLAVLALLRTPHYGYDLIDRLTSAGIETSQDTLYPLLRRLEKQKLLVSEWVVDETTRPRKYYSLSTLGEQIYPRLRDQWLLYAKSIQEMIQ
jgi:DNA-binding PadR family transcriptional regulator